MPPRQIVAAGLAFLYKASYFVIMSGRCSQILPLVGVLLIFRINSAVAQPAPSPSFSKILFSRATALKNIWEKNFTLPQAGHAVANFQISSDTDWEDPKLPAVLLEVVVDERLASHLVTFMGRRNGGHVYSLHLGFLNAGQHELALQRADSSHAAIRLQNVRLDAYYANHPFYPVLGQAPIIFGRNPDMRSSDVPLLLAYEKNNLTAGDELKYTVFFSNENGGTPPLGLLHLWGRYTDIEWAYRVEMDANGKPRRGRASFQGKDHRELPYFGSFENEQPALQVATLNNLFDDSLTTPLRFALPPFSAIPPDGMRESVMLEAPWTWQVSAKEARREQRLLAQPADSMRIADLQRYLYIQFSAEPETPNMQAGGYFIARYKNDPNAYTSNLGNPRLTIRSDKKIVRQTAVPLPAGRSLDDLQQLQFAADSTGGSLILKNVMRIFSLEVNDLPRQGELSWRGSLRLIPGQRATIFEKN